MKEIVILGSTGSIGTQTLDVVRANIREFSVKGLACGHRIDKLLEQIIEFHPEIVVVANCDDAENLKIKLKEIDTDSAYIGVSSKCILNSEETDFRFGEILVYHGREGLKKAASYKCDVVVNALMGISGLEPTVAAINSGNDVALANKETLVAGGQIVMSLASEKNVDIIPIDSEHSAIYQCLKGNDKKDVRRILLTGSGGPFRTLSKEELVHVTKVDALNHPKWNMGEKITIDSASMMNKGLELIEAKWLFDIEYNKIDILIHPESIVHSMVEFVDGSIIAQMGPTDMRLPISYAISENKRIKNDFPKLDFFNEGSKLEFFRPNPDKFRCLALAIEAIKIGGTAPAILNGANEEVVSMFLEDKIKFIDISDILDKVMNSVRFENQVNLENVFTADDIARKTVRGLVKKEM